MIDNFKFIAKQNLCMKIEWWYYEWLYEKCFYVRVTIFVCLNNKVKSCHECSCQFSLKSQSSLISVSAKDFDHITNVL